MIRTKTKLVTRCKRLQYLLWFIVFTLASPCFSQTKFIDSLRAAILQAENNDEKLKTVFLLCDEANSLNPDTLYKYTLIAATLANQSKLNNNKLQANLYKAIFLSKKGNFDLAEKLIDSSLTALKPAANPGLANKFQLLKSNMFIRSNRQKESISNSLQVLHGAEQAKDLAIQVRAKILIGWAYMELGQTRDALNWLFSAETIQQQLQQQQWQPFLYSNIAAVYNELSKNDSAEIYIKRSLALALRKNDLSYLANTYFIYSDICSDLNQTSRAEFFLQQGAHIREKIGDPFYIVSDIYQLGLFYADNNEPEKGIADLRRGISMAHQYGLYEKLPILYNALASNYKIAGNHIQYGKTLDTIILLKDSLYKKNAAVALAEMQAKYELQKKENTIIQQHYDLAKKDLYIYYCHITADNIIECLFPFRKQAKEPAVKIAGPGN